MAETTMRERKKGATKSNILKSAIELIKANGFADTTMQVIAHKADVALRTLYNYFPTKESIVATYIRNVVEEETAQSWDQLVEIKNTVDRLLFICERSAEWSKRNVILTEVYASDPRNYFYAASDKVPRSGLDEVAARVLRMGQEMGDIICSVPVEVLARQFMGLFYVNILTWLGDPDQDLAKMLKDSMRIFYNGIGVRRDER